MQFFSHFIHQVKRINKVLLVLTFFIGFILVYLLLTLTVFDPDENSLSYSDNHINVLDLSIPTNLDFCGERIPTDDYEIKEDLKKEFIHNAYWKSSSLILFHKVQRWFPYIEPILKQEGVPDDFKYLAVIESHLSNARSGAGAAGFWQLVASSAGNYGLLVNDQVDERFHVEKATRAACAHIKEAYKIFHNWTLAAAAYNRGINGLLAAMKDQKTSDYHELLLNKETGSFVYRILAFKTLLSSPEHFGIKKKKWRYFSKIPYKIIKVDSSIHSLKLFAEQMGVDERLLKAHNPWLLANQLDNPDHRLFEIRIPKNLKLDYSSYLSDLYPGYIDAGAAAVKAADTLNKAIRFQLVFIDNERSLDELSKEFQVTADDLRKWNHLDAKQQSVKSLSLMVVDPGPIHVK